MTSRIAINGFGRIGRLVLRALCESTRKDIDIVAINDLGSAEANAHLLAYDSVHGRCSFDVSAGKDSAGKDVIHVDGRAIRVLCERDPGKLPWKELKVDTVLECTGYFTDRAGAAKHHSAGAAKVLISAPSKDADITIVCGVNDSELKPSHRLVSNASCTTNCLAPPVKVIMENIGFVRGFMTTIHAATGDQPTVDTLHKDWRRARAAGVSMIPTSTGAARAVSLVLPQLAGKIDGCAVRVPTANVSLVDLTFDAGRTVHPDDINQAMCEAAQGEMKGILDVSDQPLVSIDFVHHSASSIVDLSQTQVSDGSFCRILAWYDNEWGFSNRMLDVAAKMATL